MGMDVLEVIPQITINILLAILQITINMEVHPVLQITVHTVVPVTLQIMVRLVLHSLTNMLELDTHPAMDPATCRLHITVLEEV
jgi:hypothetical protein